MCILEKPYVDLFGYPCVYRSIFLRSEYVTPVLMFAILLSIPCIKLSNPS
jgi:hypothetical protein